MNIRLRNPIKGDLEFSVTPVMLPGGGQRLVALAFSPDGAMWLDPGEFGIGPQHATQLAKFPGGTYLLTNPFMNQTLINAKAVVHVIPDDEWCRDWLVCVERMIQEHKEERVRHEANRNN